MHNHKKIKYICYITYYNAAIEGLGYTHSQCTPVTAEIKDSKVKSKIRPKNALWVYFCVLIRKPSLKLKFKRRTKDKVSYSPTVLYFGISISYSQKLKGNCRIHLMYDGTRSLHYPNEQHAAIIRQYR